MERQIQSAGGILLKPQQGNILIAVVERYRDVEPKWAPVLCQLPKGGCEDFESSEATALREVEEETGFASEVIGLAGTASWSYTRGGHSWHETVTYFFLKPAAENPDMRDDEFDAVLWIPIQEAASRLSYPEERELINNILANKSLPDYLTGSS